MPRLKCGVESCTFWHDKLCSRSGIQVKGDTALKEDDTRCSSYRERNRVSQDNSYNLEIGEVGFDTYLSVNCEAVNCKFNHNLICHAKEIKIDGTRSHNSKDTFCSSFDLK